LSRAKIAHWFPGVGDPFALEIAQFFSLLNSIVAIENWKNGEADQLSELDRDLERWEQEIA
jgi:hypothetical protein